MTEIPVPRTLRSPHRFVQATRDAAAGLAAADDGRLDVGRAPGLAHVQVSRSELTRALRILQAVLAEAERRGHEVVPVEKAYNRAAGIGIRLRGQTYGLKIYELRDKQPLTDSEVRRWEHENRFQISFGDLSPPKTRLVANGRLALSIEHDYGSGRRSNWREGPRGPLEEKLVAFFLEVEDRAIADEREAARRSLEREAREREVIARREREHQLQVEEERGSRLLAETRVWRDLADARAYIAALRERLDDLQPDERKRISVWCEWAAAWIEHRDPARNTNRIRGMADKPSHPSGGPEQ